MSIETKVAAESFATAASSGVVRSPAVASGRLRYVDGLRALAILAVVAFHARLPGFRGGFVGVDVFLVISGFLITNQIASQAFSGRFSATDFYARRILRILPPLLFVVLAVLAGASLFPLLPQELKQLDISAAATAAMFSNYYFASGVEYFASNNSEVQPLLHTWSLGLEEQYYLVAPWFISAIMLLASRRKWSPARSLIAFTLGAIALSYAAGLILTHHDHRLAFFSMFTRAWQFASGGVLAVAVLGGASLPARARLPASLAGLLAVAASVLLFSKDVHYPGFAAIVPTAGALLILAAGIGDERSTIIRILASRPAVAIGVLSYSWYLWHWPLLALTRSLDVGHAGLAIDLAVCAVALGFSVPTYWFIERPMRDLRQQHITRRFGGRIVAIGLAGSAVVALIALGASRNPALDRRLSAQDTGRPSLPLTGCRTPSGGPKSAKTETCMVGTGADPGVLVWGDSHAGMLVPVADWSAQQTGQTALVLASMACPPLLGIEIDHFSKRHCADMNAAVSRWLANRQPGSMVGIVLAARWAFYNGRDTPSPSEVAIPRVSWKGAGMRASAFEDMLADSLGAVLRTIDARARVLIMGSVPELDQIAPDCIFRAQLYGRPRSSCAMSRTEVETRRAESMNVLRRLTVEHPEVMLIDPIDVFCDREECRPFGGDGIYYSDENHLTPLGSERLYRSFRREFLWVFGGSPTRN